MQIHYKMRRYLYAVDFCKLRDLHPFSDTSHTTYILLQYVASLELKIVFELMPCKDRLSNSNRHIQRGRDFLMTPNVISYHWLFVPVNSEVLKGPTSFKGLSLAPDLICIDHDWHLFTNCGLNNFDPCDVFRESFLANF